MSGAASTDAIPRQGEIMVDKYRIERELGRGGMGVVLAAHHLHLDEPVAIKFLLPELISDAGVVSRFLREGRSSIKIRSEHVARVLDVATMPGGTPYMVMEYLDGSDIEQLISRSGPLPFTTAVDYMLQALEAIAEAHSLGMVHRDLKPANLFLVRRRDGTPCIKVLDFGITKVTSSDPAAMNMTNTSAVMGSPRYMSPEQMRSSRAVDGRADIWALGTVLHEMLTGVPPFDGGTMPELLVSILQDPPPPLTRIRPDAPPELERIILHCLEKDPANRFQNVVHLAWALVPFGSPATARVSAERTQRILRVTDSHPPPSAMSSTAAGGFSAAQTGANTRTPSSPGITNPGQSTANAWGTSAPDLPPPPKSNKGVVVASAVTALVVVLGIGIAFFALRKPGDTRTTASATASAATTTPSATAATTATVTATATATETAASAATTAAPESTAPSATAKTASGTQSGPAGAATSTTPKTKPTGAAKPAGKTSAKDDILFDGRH